jgi:antitoxin Phd
MAKWQLQEAKARLSEVVRRAGTDGPQTITYRGKDSVVVVAAGEYERLVGRKKSFVDFLLSIPKLDEDALRAINRRDRRPARRVDL